jgi:hypothetical protein
VKNASEIAFPHHHDWLFFAQSCPSTSASYFTMIQSIGGRSARGQITQLIPVESQKKEHDAKKFSGDSPRGWVRSQNPIATRSVQRDSMQAAGNGNLSLIQDLRTNMESTLAPNASGSRVMRFMHAGQEFRAVMMPSPANMIQFSNAAGPIGSVNYISGAYTPQMGSQETIESLLQSATSTIHSNAPSNSGLDYAPGPHAAPAAMLAANIERQMPIGINGVRTLNFQMNGTMCQAFTHHSSPQSISFVSPFGLGSVDAMTGRHNNMGGDASAFQMLAAANLHLTRNVAA